MTTPETAIRHIIDGRELPGDEPLRCAKCSARLSEGQPVTAAAEPTAESWRVAHLWDVGCAPTSCESVVQPVVIEGTIAAVADTARQRHYPVLVDVVVADRRQAVEA